MLFLSQTLFMLHHKIWSSQIRTLWVRSTWSHRFVIDLNFQNLSVHFGLTDSSFSVIPSSLSFSSFQSRCNRLELFGHTELQQLLAILHLGATELFHSVTSTGLGYICRRVKFSKFLQNLFARACPALPPRVSGSSSRCQRPPAAGRRRRQRHSAPPLPP